MPRLDKKRLKSAWKLVQDGAERHAFAGVVGLVATGNDDVALHESCGFSALLPKLERMKQDTIFDLASLTKVIATTTCAMLLFEEGKLSLDEPVSRFLPRFSGGGKEKVAVKHLLTHTSGLPAWSDLYVRHKDKEGVIGEICENATLESRAGMRALYSDLGFIVLGSLVEQVSGRPLDKFAGARVFRPLGMKDTLFRPPSRLRGRSAATEFSNFRFRFVRGEVHDENAFAMGGVSGHAGLFSTSGDLARFGTMMMNCGKYDDGSERLLKAETVELMTRNHSQELDSYFGLGWWVKTPKTPNVGTRLSESSFGHNGYTGTSIWIDPLRNVLVILLTNRVHPVREGDPQDDRSIGIMMQRRANWRDVLKSFHDRVVSAFR